MLRMPDLPWELTMQGSAFADQLLATTLTLLEASPPQTALGALLFLLPKWLSAHFATAMCHLGFCQHQERARSAVWGVSDALARNYCLAHPRMGLWETPPGVAGHNNGLVNVPKDAIPSEHSILAALLQANHKCALS
jgi:hypothetical protein